MSFGIIWRSRSIPLLRITTQLPYIPIVDKSISKKYTYRIFKEFAFIWRCGGIIVAGRSLRIAAIWGVTHLTVIVHKILFKAPTLSQLKIKRGVGCYATPLRIGGRNTCIWRCGNNSSTPYGMETVMTFSCIYLDVSFLRFIRTSRRHNASLFQNVWTDHGLSDCKVTKIFWYFNPMMWWSGENFFH